MSKVCDALGARSVRPGDTCIVVVFASAQDAAVAQEKIETREVDAPFRLVSPSTVVAVTDPNAGTGAGGGSGGGRLF